jgi:hypothetical protein
MAVLSGLQLPSNYLLYDILISGSSGIAGAVMYDLFLMGAVLAPFFVAGAYIS